MRIEGRFEEVSEIFTGSQIAHPLATHIYTAPSKSEQEAMDEVIDSISAELLCPLSNTLLIAPVLCEDSRSMVELGETYLKGNAGRDAAKAFELFERASELEDEIGTVRKADCLLTGTGVEKDFDEGFQIMVEAAQIDKSGERDFRRKLLLNVFYNIITNITLSASYIETHVLLQRWHPWLSTR